MTRPLPNQLTEGDERQSFQVKGLSCANCARECEIDIRRLENGKDAELHYNSGTLKIHPSVNRKQVERILRRDGAYLVEAGALTGEGFTRAGDSKGKQAHDYDSLHAVGHEHEHGHEPHNCEGHSHDAHAHSNTHNHTHDHADASHGHGESHSHDHSHGHSHEHGSMKRMKWFLGISSVLYVSTFLLDGRIPQWSLISLYLIAVLLSGHTTFMQGLRNLFRLRFNMDTLMTVALTGAVVMGEWKEATLVAILFGLNEILEGYGMERARQSVASLLEVAPKQANVLRHGETVTIPIDQLQVNDTVVVRPGEKIPSDGTVLDGISGVNEAAITGESLPVAKEVGSSVYGGSINTSGLLKVRVDKAYQDSSLAKILHLVREAQDTKTPTELFIDKFAQYYTPVIMIIAALVMVVPPLLLDGDWFKWVYQGFAVLIVGCPCALILSSPIAIVSGITRTARMGILVKGGVHLEQLGKINALAFDKTGTLTKGEPAVIAEAVYDQGRCYEVIGAVEQGSLHPLAKAMIRYVNGKGMAKFAEPSHAETVAGEGIEVIIEGMTYLVGSERILNRDGAAFEQARADAERMKAQGYTIVAVAEHGRPLGVFGLADEIREESRATIQALHDAHITHTIMLTGDHKQSAARVAEAVGVSEWHAGLLPEQKVEQVKELAKKYRVAMVGDGINDAPALASAQLGIAMGKGTDSAVETADIVLMQDHLGKLPAAIRVSRLVNRVIRLNIGLSLGLKIIALLLTIPGWLTLWIAILSDMGATIVVTLLGLTILLGKDRE
ncbi:heavy metal translocating P-type ATPase [Paenibacillus taiwanensis]|uniref:heavy metal translocating P-type ATPase n=1 Tax=Paenibacillus taiwanensis TaxID=401638 RepID=UPI000414822C|nr:heavy metal translocating P-type ATPase [Paenibacillus taiwanensis]